MPPLRERLDGRGGRPACLNHILNDDGANRRGGRSPRFSLPVPCDFASFLHGEWRTGAGERAGIRRSRTTRIRPSVRPPTAFMDPAGHASAASASGPIVARPSGLIVVRRASI